jgi:sulfonate transport system ATP-binding protein
VSKQFCVRGAPLHVLDSLDLSVGPGEFLTIVGASVCGKSTLLRLIAGLDTDFQGVVVLDGHSYDNEYWPTCADEYWPTPGCLTR